MGIFIFSFFLYFEVNGVELFSIKRFTYLQINFNFLFLNKAPGSNPVSVKIWKPLQIPIAHNEGNYFADEKTLKELKDNNQIVLKYCDENSNINEESNPNGSCLNIAGIINKNKNVIGMMPHPERCVENILGGTDGSGIFQSLLN